MAKTKRNIESLEAETKELNDLLKFRAQEYEQLRAEFVHQNIQLRQANEQIVMLRRENATGNRVVGEQQRSLHTLIRVLGEVTPEKVTRAA